MGSESEVAERLVFEKLRDVCQKSLKSVQGETLNEARIKQALRMDMLREGLMQPTDSPTIKEEKYEEDD